MPRYNKETKAQAVARIKAGDKTASAIAIELGAGHNTVLKWVADYEAEQTGTDSEKELATAVNEIRESIERKQEEVRDLLLKRIEALIPSTDDLKAVATAYGIVTDKQLLAQGKPTSITAQGVAIPADATPLQLREQAAALGRKMQQADKARA